jgi:hypothetical protein
MPRKSAVYHRRKADANQQEIVKALLLAGASVVDLHTVGRGVPDILVAYKNMNLLMEIKDGKGKLTSSEEQFFATWRGPTVVVHDPQDALDKLYIFTEKQ